MSTTRRQFIQAATFAGLAWPLGVRAQPDQLASRRFTHGVASGDPMRDRVMIWTRAEPDPSVSASSPPSVQVRWLMATDPTLTHVVQKGTAITTADRDYTVKVDAGGLAPGRTYYYAFDVAGERSPTGRTRTLPQSGARSLRFALVCCANYPAGFFNVYRCLANRADLDAVIHVGDYIYEFADGVYGDGALLGRIPQPRTEAITLADYRLRYATYRTDPDLQDAHRQHPFIAVWDDHELANDAWTGGAINHNPELGEGDWSVRRAAAYRAYLEWMPIREFKGQGIHLYRGFHFGGLVDLVMLDTRGLRDKQPPPSEPATFMDPKRRLMGAAQEAWFYDTLRSSERSGSAWRLIGQQVLFSKMAPAGKPVRLTDDWDGYQAERERVLDVLRLEPVRDVAILTGDMHSSWAFDVPRDPWGDYDSHTGTGSLAVELVAPAISSPPFFPKDQADEMIEALRPGLPHLKFIDGLERGYVLLDITAARLRADWLFTPSVTKRSDKERIGASFVCERGSGRLTSL